MKLDPMTQRNVDSWLNGDYDATTKAQIKHLLETNPKEITNAFYADLNFGTGGLRGIMGLGTHRINGYTIRATTQGLAHYLLQQPAPPEGHSVFIGYDSRHHSKEFAEETAKVFAGNGIYVYLYKELRPSPMISFGCRLKKCSAGIMITASHNPKDYNGYKVYWNDGAQILPPHDKNILREIQKIADPLQVKSTHTLDHPLIHWVGEDVDTAYLAAIRSLQIDGEQNHKEGEKLKIVYTSLHGTGITVIPRALREAGFSSLLLVDKQTIPDGNFPTVKSPNPEEKSALKLGIAQLEASKADLLIATDPDTDRMGIAVHHQGQVLLLNGNQVACICLAYILERLSAKNKLPEKAIFVKTIATTELFKAICEGYQKPCIDVLTGFKYIAEKIRELEKDPKGFQFVFGAEESYGYLLGTQTRDKDAVTASILIAEVALNAKLKSKTLVDLLQDIYKNYGYYFEKLLSIKYEETKESKEQVTKSLDKLQSSPPKVLAGIPVQSVENYKTSIKTDLKTSKSEPLKLPSSNVLLFWLEDGSKLMIRPSGTEPKVKIYCAITKRKFTSLEEAARDCEKRADALVGALARFLTITIDTHEH